MDGGRWELVIDEKVFQVISLGLPVGEHQCEPLRGSLGTSALCAWETLVVHRTSSSPICQILSGGMMRELPCQLGWTGDSSNLKGPSFGRHNVCALSDDVTEMSSPCAHGTGRLCMTHFCLDSA